MKFGRSRMMGNSLSYEMFKGANCEASFFVFFFFFETDLKVAFGLYSGPC